MHAHATRVRILIVRTSLFVAGAEIRRINQARFRPSEPNRRQGTTRFCGAEGDGWQDASEPHDTSSRKDQNDSTIG